LTNSLLLFNEEEIILTPTPGSVRGVALRPFWTAWGGSQFRRCCRL